MSRVKDLVSRERAVTLEVLVHLIEVERRRLHLGLGYPSMFEYCLGHLGYSASAAARRIRAARCIRDYPEVYRLLEKNEVTLITISLVAPILEETNAKDLIEKIRGKSQREVEAITAAYRPPVSMRDRARPVCVAVSTPSAPQLNGPGGASTASAGSEKTPNMIAADSVGGPPQALTLTQAQLRASNSPGDFPPTSAKGDVASPSEPRSKGGSATSPTHMERKFIVQFLASPRFMNKFEKAKALLSNKNGKPSYEAVLEVALDEFLKDHDPESRDKRRAARKQKAESKAKPVNRGNNGASQPKSGRIDGEPAHAEDPSRHISASTRDAVFRRDGGRCTYTGSNGVRCAATHHLQIDHVVPYARGGTNALANLRLLCERHNKHEAGRLLGADTVGRFRRRE